MLLAAGIAAISSGAAFGQPVTPFGHSAIYDPVRQRMVVFGGLAIATSIPTDSVWTYALDDEPRWDPLTPVGTPPSRRAGHSAVYDPVRDRMLVFGGLDGGGSYLADVWALSLSGTPAWSAPPTAATPAPPLGRRFHSAIYDPLRDRLVVFGGRGVGSPYFNDVWALSLGDTMRWAQLPTLGDSPSPRWGHSAVYDAARDRMLIFGDDQRTDDRVWSLSLADPSVWTTIDSIVPGPPPPARYGHSATYDPASERMIVFGGHSRVQSEHNDVWSLSLAGRPAWRLSDSLGVAPSPRLFPSAALDTAYHRMVIFGGDGSDADATWALRLDDPMRWGPDRPLIEVSPARLSVPAVTVGDTVQATFAISNLGLRPLQVGQFSLPVFPGLVLEPSDPARLSWSREEMRTLRLSGLSADSTLDSLVIESNDPRFPRKQVELELSVLGLEFETRLLEPYAQVPLGVSVIVVVVPRPRVRVESGSLHYRVSGETTFAALPLISLGTDFIGVIPAGAVTERGVDYYVRIENSGSPGTRPSEAPDSFYSLSVAPPDSFVAIPRPTSASGSEFLEDLDIDVEVLLPPGAVYLSGAIAYRRGGERRFESAPLSQGGSIGRPTGVIPDSMVGPRGVEYWVEVTTFGNASPLRFPVRDSVSVIRTKVQALSEPRVHAGFRYRLLTVPLDFGPDLSQTLEALLIDDVGADSPADWRAFRYDPRVPGNVELSSTADTSFRPRPGRAFWLISRAPHRIDTPPIDGFSTPTGRAFPIALEPGWNLIGNPFDFPVAWSDVARNPATVEQPFAFDPSLRQVGDYAKETPTVLMPFEGYFVYADRPETLWVAARDTAGSGIGLEPVAPAADGPATAAGSDAPWAFGLAARTDQAVDNPVAIGLQSGANAGFDPLDSRKPPSPPGPWVRMAVVHPDWGERSGEYRRDLRSPDTEGETWELETRSGTTGEPVTLEFTETTTAPSGVTVRLIDREQGNVIDWTGARREPGGEATGTVGDREPGRYRFVSFGPHRYRLALVAGSNEYVSRATRETRVAPTLVTLEQNAPNPFRLATRIRFGLPRAARVSLEIFSVLGERVATPVEDALLEAGFHNAVWDGTSSDGTRAPNGVYFARVRAAGETLTRRLAIVR